MKKVSGSKTIFVDISTSGKIKIPYDDYLKDKIIRYIDVVRMDKTLGKYTGKVNEYKDATINLFQRKGNVQFVDSLPLSLFDVESNLGVRLPINKCINFENSFIEVQNYKDNVTIPLVFYFEDSNDTSKITDNINYTFISSKLKSDRSYFDEKMILSNKKLRKIIYTGDDVIAKSTYLNIVKGNKYIMENIPLKLFNLPNFFEEIDFANVTFDLTKSYIKLGKNYESKDQVINLNIIYQND